MKKDAQIASLQELLTLKANNTPFLNEQWSQTSVLRYSDEEHFQQEQDAIFRTDPLIALHSSELPEPGSFVTESIAGIPVLFIRDDSGQVQTFLNVCRHRGAELVGDASGCKNRFSCPYHAWTWNLSGELIAIPHGESGFPHIDKSAFGLQKIPTQEYAGFIWVVLTRGAPIDVELHLGELSEDIKGMGADRYKIFAREQYDCAANWKILTEGGIEAYHFKVAHRNTIAPLFLNNLSSYQTFGPHIRSVLPRSTLTELNEKAQNDWNIYEHSNVLYSLFPNTSFLVQEDHFVWIRKIPVSADRSILRLCTMIHEDQDTEAAQNHWQLNHDFTVKTLLEDFQLGESIQRGMTSGANEVVNFGQFEGALTYFNKTVDQRLAEYSRRA